MEKRQLKLGAFMRPVSIHTGAWRYPGAWPDANFNFPHIRRLIQKLEAGKFDAFFMADHLAVLNMPVNALKRSHTVTSFEPFTLLSALAGVTERIGLIATASTTFDEAYHIARRFASLDHISGGRAGWNIVTTSNPDAALNFGLDDHMEHDERYVRAREFYDVVTGLWDSFADDAFVRDVEQGLYFDPARMHVLNHKGKYLSVRGPLNIARPVQGWPVIVQAGASEDGRQLAAETAEAVFTGGGSLADGQKLYADIKGRMDRLGRNRDHLKILPGAFVVVGESIEEAKEKRALLDSKVHYDSALASLSVILGTDASGFDPEGPLPPIPETNASKSGRQRLVDLAARDKLTVRHLAYRQRDSLLGLLPGKHADFGLRREHRGLHGDGVWMRRNIIGQDQYRRLAIADEIARDGEDEIGVGAIHFGQEFMHHLHGDVAPSRGALRTPVLHVSFVEKVAHFRARAAGLRQHGRDDTIGCPAQQVPDHRAADAESENEELVDAEVIHQAKVIVGVCVPWPVDFERAGGLPATGVAQVRSDAAVLCFELLHRIEGRVAGQVGDGRVQSPTSNHQQWEAATRLFKVNANGAFFVEAHGSSSLADLLSKQACRRASRRRCSYTRRQYLASDWIHSRRASRSFAQAAAARQGGSSLVRKFVA